MFIVINIKQDAEIINYKTEKLHTEVNTFFDNFAFYYI